MRTRTVPQYAAVARPDGPAGFTGTRIDTGAAPHTTGAALLYQVTTQFGVRGDALAEACAYYADRHAHGFASIVRGPVAENYCYCHDGGQGDAEPLVIDVHSVRACVGWLYLISDLGLMVHRVHPLGLSDPEVVPWSQDPDDRAFWRRLTAVLADWRP